MKPKVLMVVPRLDIGGTERHLVRVLTALRETSIDASLFVLERGGQLEPVLASAGVAIFGSPAGGWKRLRVLRSGWALFRHLRRNPPDIVHFFLPEAYLVGALVSIVAGIKLRIMSRRSLAVYQMGHPILGLIEMWLHRRTRALLGNSKAVAEELVNECGDRGKVGIIFNGVNMRPIVTSNLRAAIRVELGIPDQALVLVIVANLIGYKGHDNLLAAMGLIKDRLPDPWRLMIIGRDDGIAKNLLIRANEFGIAERVMWLGARMDAERLIEAADISVISSHQEGFSNSLIESMSVGLPVIATAVGGNTDAIVNGETGLLVAAKAPHELSAAILALAADPARRARMGKAASDRVEKVFSLTACVARYVRLYQGAAAIGTMAVQDIIEGTDKTANPSFGPAVDRCAAVG